MPDVIYGYDNKIDVQNDKYPLNLHLVFETDNAVYWVDSSNAKVLLKTVDNGTTVTTVETRTNKDIARAWHDRTNNIIYFVDCDYDDTTSYIWSLNTSTDDINEITSVPADVFDIWIYDSDLWYYYFGAGGYSLETENLNPNGDNGTYWTDYPSGSGHYADVDEGTPPNISDYVYTFTLDQTENYTFPNTLDLSSYDSGEIYEIVVKLYGKGGAVDVDGNLTGMTTQRVTFNSETEGWQQAVFSGLSLEDSDIDDLEITMTNKSDERLKISGTTTSLSLGGGCCIDDTTGAYILATRPAADEVIIYNTSLSQLDSFSISECSIPYGIHATWQDVSGDTVFTIHITDQSGYVREYTYNYTTSTKTYVGAHSVTGTYHRGICLGPSSNWYILDYYARNIHVYNSSWTYVTTYSSVIPTNCRGLCYDGTYFYTARNNGYIYQYNTSFVQQDEFAVETYNSDLSGVGTDDGDNFYIVDQGSNKISLHTIETYVYIYTQTVDIKFYGDTLTALIIYNHTDDISDSHDMGVPGVRTWQSSQIVNVDDQFWFLWKWSDENVELWKYDISGAAFTEMEDCGSNTDFPDSDSQWGISYDDDDILYFVLKDTSDTYKYLYTYEITGDDLTKGIQYNVALMLNRNTDSTNNPPFNLEKAYHLSNRYIYQIAKNRGHLYKIADLTSIVDDGTIVGITDSYLFIKRTSNDIELWKMVDISSHFVEIRYLHEERNYSIGSIIYDKNYYTITEDMFIQIIGTATISGTTYTNIVVFEGTAAKPTDFNDDEGDIKIAKITSRAKNDLENTFQGSLTTDSDTYESTIIASMNYITEGTLASGQSLPSISYNSSKKNKKFLDQLVLGDELTYRLRPQGELDTVDGTTNSTVSYNGTTAPKMFGVTISEKTIRPNKVIVKGGYVSGVQIVSTAAEDTTSQAVNGVIPLTVTIAWISTQALANAYATAILNVIGVGYTQIDFMVRDTTNGFVIIGDYITLEHTALEISSGTYIVNKVEVDAKNSRYIYSAISILKWSESDIGTGRVDEVSDQIDQLGTDIASMVSDEAYGITWDSITDVAASKNAIYDAIEGLISDAAYGSGWNGVTDVAPSKNAIYDEVESHYAETEPHHGHPFIHIQHREASGINGGTLTAWTWETRPITNLLTDTHSICSINVSTDIFTLPAGTYIIDISAQAYDCKSHHLRLYNTTDSSVEALGQVGYLETTDNCGASSVLRHVLTIASTKSFRVEQESSATKAAIGMGFAQAGFGDNEIYMDIFIWKIA